MSSTSLPAESQVGALGRPTKRRTVLTGLAISGITVALSVISVETAGYFWERKTAEGPLGWTLVASRRLDLEPHGDPDRPFYLFEPGVEYTWEGIPVHINSRGLRTDEFQVPKPSDTYRILNLGDSIAFGWEVRLEDTYGKLIEEQLNAAGGDIRYEVINAGVPTWNLESERDFLLSEGLRYQPDLVLLDLTIVNDIYGRGPSISEDISLFGWLRDNTYAWPFLTTQARFLLANYQGPEAIPVLNPPSQASSYYPVEEESPVWNEIWELITEIREASERAGAVFGVVVFPTALQLNSSGHPDVPQMVLSERALIDGVTLIDLLPQYGQVCGEAEYGACEGYENLLFADVWMHPNELGHQLAADEIISWLSSQLAGDNR